jgi:Fe-S cluster assembly protein SufD
MDEKNLNEISNIKERYLNNFGSFERSLNGGKSSVLHDLRKDALSSFSSLPFPTTKDEEWKYTNLAPLLKHNFTPAAPGGKAGQDEVNKFLFDELEHSLIVFINGHYSEELSRLKDLPEGVIIKSLAKALTENDELVSKYFGRYAAYNDHVFTALSTAFIKDGAFVYVPKNKIVEEPLHILYLNTSAGEKLLVQPRNLFIAEKNSQATIIEHYTSSANDIYFTNTVTEVVVEENAFLDHIKLQEESRKAFHIARMETEILKNGNFASHFISTGAELSRNDFNARFGDEGGECTLNGLYLIEESQHFDAHTVIDHASPHCNSHEHYKGILDDRSRGVFNGKVMVRRDAQKTNAFQENNNIILSDSALVNTKPQLEIFADDVKCSHGATIGQLDNDAMFYLKARGIGEEKSRAILLHAFASDVIKTIKINQVRNYLEEIINRKFTLG